MLTPEGQALAFPADQASAALTAGLEVTLRGVRILADGGGLVAATTDGEPIASHQSFWFAWSQFHPDTLVWSPLE